MVGTWEWRGEKHAPVEQTFLSLDSRGNFKWIQIAKLRGRQGRLESGGKWRISDGEFIQELTKIHEFQSSGSFIRRKIVSLHEDLAILRTPLGGTEELRRRAVPPHLPPVFSFAALEQAITLTAPKPQYPFSARQRRLQGKGLFILTVDEKTGVVTLVRVEQSTGHGILDEAAIGTLKNWRFKPQTVDKLRVPVNFTLTRP